jgi:benzylsuccinate CoA-transferase BbsE subunit
MLGGKLLGDLGADVIKVEPPGGSSSRIAPYYKNIADPEKSLFWFAYNLSKRGITLNIGEEPGRNLFRKLVKTADIIIESFEPGYMSDLKLGYSDLCKIKPDIIYASISLFGQNGPKSQYKGSDLTTWATGGYMYACGNPDRAPVWISFPQAGFFGGAEAAIGSMTAILHRWNTGEGQHIDISMQEGAISPNMQVLQMWDVAKVTFKRTGGCLVIPNTGVNQYIYFKCKDGYINIMLQGGTEPFLTSSGNLVKWMTEEGMAPDWLQKLDWAVDYNAATMGQEIADRVRASVENFTLTKTKNELYIEGSIKRGILLAPVNNTKDISEDLQLEARVFWREMEHPELNATLAYCGPFIKMSGTPIEYKRRAPLIGEHNKEIYIGELGISEEKLNFLKNKRII